jgi:acyl-CoA thioesterase-1
MNPAAGFFGSGYALFLGAALLVTATLLTMARWRFRAGAARLIALAGATLFILSSAPLPWLLYGAWGAAVAAWMWLERDEGRPRVRVGARVAVAVLCAAAVLMELPWQFTPKVHGSFRTLYVIGDSISAGIGGAKERNWPRILGDTHGITAVDLSRAAETVASALERTDKVREAEALVLLEIGGNDMLGFERGGKFEVELDALLRAVAGPKRTLVMMEIPLPPFCNRFGAVQRRLARKHNALLIPKRVFMRVLTGPGATVDGLHLSQAGHERMAAALWEILSPAFRPDSRQGESGVPG